MTDESTIYLSSFALLSMFSQCNQANSQHELIMDCEVRWNSCFFMLQRFIEYQSVIENVTILHQSVIGGLSSSVVGHLKKLAFTDEEWDHLIATCNVLQIFNQAWRLLSGHRYQTLSIGYIVSCGLYHALLQSSSTPQVCIENIIRMSLLDAFTKHFDTKLSNDQKESLIVSIFRFYTFFALIEFSITLQLFRLRVL